MTTSINEKVYAKMIWTAEQLVILMDSSLTTKLCYQSKACRNIKEVSAQKHPTYSSVPYTSEAAAVSYKVVGGGQRSTKAD